jgi:hypothetical protein
MQPLTYQPAAMVFNLSDEQVLELVHSNRLELGEYTLRLSSESDDVNPFEYFDCYGRVERADRGGWGCYRPAGFDGSAEKLRLQAGVFWWQPYREGRKVYGGSKERAYVADLIDYGLQVLELELLGPVWDAQGRQHASVVLDSACVCGVEPFPDTEHTAELVRCLLEDINPPLDR